MPRSFALLDMAWDGIALDVGGEVPLLLQPEAVRHITENGDPEA